MKGLKNKILICSAIAVLLMALLSSCGQSAGADGAGSAVSENAAGGGNGTEAKDGGPGSAGSGQGAAEQAEDGDPAAKLEEQLRLAWNFLTEGNYKEAVLAFTAVIDIDPKNGDAYMGRAESYMGLAGETGEYREYSEYVALAFADYDQAQTYLTEGADLQELVDARVEIKQQLLKELGEEAREAADEGNYDLAVTCLRKAVLLRPYEETLQSFRFNPYNMWDLWKACEEGARGSMEMDQIHNYTSLLMEMIDGAEAAGIAPDLMSQESIRAGLYQMLVGAPYLYRSQLTGSYIEEIDRPIVEFTKTHEAFAGTRYGVMILFEGSIALGDMGSADGVYEAYMAEITKDREGYSFGSDGYTWTGTDGSVSQYDRYGRIVRLQTSNAVETWEYETAGPRILSQILKGNDGWTDDISYEYENGRLASEHEIHTDSRAGYGNYRYDYTYEYAGGQCSITRTYDLENPQTTVWELDYYGGSRAVSY